MTTDLYAAYGSNLHPARLNQRVPSTCLIGTSRVPGFELLFHKRSIDGSAKCNVVEAESEIYVAVYEVRLDEKRLLDNVEGLGIGYDELRMSVPGVGDCWTYTAAQSHIDAKLVPYDWYKALVILGCEYNAFPGDYVQCVRGISERRDHDTQRRERNMELVASISKDT